MNGKKWINNVMRTCIHTNGESSFQMVASLRVFHAISDQNYFRLKSGKSKNSQKTRERQQIDGYSTRTRKYHLESTIEKCTNSARWRYLLPNSAFCPFSQWKGLNNWKTVATGRRMYTEQEEQTGSAHHLVESLPHGGAIYHRFPIPVRFRELKKR